MYHTSYLNFKYLPLPFLAFKAKRSIRITNGQLHVTIYLFRMTTENLFVAELSCSFLQRSLKFGPNPRKYKNTYSKWSRYTTKYYKRDPLGKLSEIIALVELSRHEQYHFFYPNTNTQYFQRGLNNTQYQYQFFDESLTIPNTNTNIHEQS